MAASTDANPLNNSWGKSRVVYRLAHRKTGKETDDEWMYRLKDEEDQSPFAAVNGVFNRLATGHLEEAKHIWAKINDDPAMLSETSIVAQRSLANAFALLDASQTK